MKSRVAWRRAEFLGLRPLVTGLAELSDSF